MPVALVTGASRGIGRAAALALAEAGFGIGVLARSHEGLEETCGLLEACGASPVAVVADVSDAEAVRDAVTKIEARAGGIAVLVNNAGSMEAVGPVWEVDPRDWWADITTSLGGAFTCCRQVVPQMMARREGRIINLVSYAAFRPAPYQTGYAAAKAGLASFTEGLAASLEGHGITVFGVAPGFTHTAMTRHLLDSEVGRRWLPELGEGRTVTEASTARLISLLASGAGDDLNGRFLHSLDDLDELLSRLGEIRRDDLYVPRLRRLPNTKDVEMDESEMPG